jgi:protein involved in polysaccharide export with SLBB domain
MMRWTVVAAAAACLCAQPAAAQQDAPAAEWSEDGIVPGDLLRVIIAREPDLTFEATVPDDGFIEFYLLGAKNVRGMGGEALRQILLREYAVYLVNPMIRLEVLRKVQVMGAVREPSVYLLHPTMTISDAVAKAGGALPEGRTDRVELRRDGRVVGILLLNDRGPLADSRIRSGDQLYVPERSVLSRHSGTAATAISGVLAIVIALLVRS